MENILIKENLNELIKNLKLDKLYKTTDNKKIKEKIINELKSIKYPLLKTEFDIHLNFDFCAELKQFYVIITILLSLIEW